MVSLAEKAPSLISEWSERNDPLTPLDVSFASHKSVWWRGKCGHEWQAIVKSRSLGHTGCPYCSNQKVLQGFNDLASCFPYLAEQWSDKNLPLLPTEVTARSVKSYWWKGKCGHEWQTRLSDRVNGHGCPYCNDHKLLKGFNDFATAFPELAKEWAEENGSLLPDDVPCSGRLIYWKCNKCGGTYQSWIENKINGSRCPYCTNRAVRQGFNDLATTHPDLVEEWDYEQNSPLLPTNITASSCTQVWWQGKCGHSWKSSISDRALRHVRCYKCETDFLYALPRLLFLLYAKRSKIPICFNSEIVPGFTCTAYLPDVSTILDIEPNSPNERQIKTHSSYCRGLNYIIFVRQDTKEKTVRMCQRIFRTLNLYFGTDLESDILAARQLFRQLSFNL